MITFLLLALGIVLLIAVGGVVFATGQRRRSGMAEGTSDPGAFPNQRRATGTRN